MNIVLDTEYKMRRFRVLPANTYKYQILRREKFLCFTRWRHYMWADKCTFEGGRTSLQDDVRV